MLNLNDIVINNIKEVQIWEEVPTYEKLDILFCIKMLSASLIGSIEARNGLCSYLKSRKRNNKKYKDFYNDTSNTTFNEDGTKYISMHLHDVKYVKSK